MTALPAADADTMPVLPTDATAGKLLAQVPPPAVLPSVTLVPSQPEAVPVMAPASASAVTVMVVVVLQPVGNE